MKKTILLIIACSFTAIINALTVNNIAGGLDNVIVNSGVSIDTLTTLKIDGKMDARDFVTIQKAIALKNLDLSGVVIAAYTGSGGTRTGYGSYSQYGIPDNAFISKTLNSIILPNNNLGIGYSAFKQIQENPTLFFSNSTLITNKSDYKYLKGKLVVDLDNPYYSSLNNILYNKDKTQLIRVGDTCLTYFNIPTQVEKVSEGAFYQNNQLKRVTLPSNLKMIGERAFAECSSLDSLKIPSSVTRIDGAAFEFCYSLTNIDLKAQIDTLSASIFNTCEKLSSIELPPTLKVIDDLAFSFCSALKGITIPYGVTEIGDGAFEYDSSLVEMKLPNTLKTIYDWGLAQTSVSSLTIPASVVNIEGDIVAESYHLKTARILAPIKTLTGGFFSNCFSLKEVYLPSSIDSIEIYVFSMDSNLTSIYLPVQKPFRVDSTVFYNVNRPSCTIYVPIGAKAAYKNANIWKDFKITEVDTLKTLNTTAGSLSSVLTNTEKHMTKKLVLSGSIDIRDIFFMRDSMPNLAAINLHAATIVGYTGSIDSTLFRAASTTPTYAANTLPKTAFKNKTVLTYISLPASLTSIQDYAFSGCTNLETIVVNNASPIDLSNTTGVFDAVDKNTCKLIVPVGSETAFRAASIWQDFLNTSTNIKNNPSQQSKLKVIVTNGKLIISGLAIGQTVVVYNLQGQAIFSQLTKAETIEVNLPTRGVYVLRVKNESMKIIF